MKQRILAFVLVFLLAFSALDVSAIADNDIIRENGSKNLPYLIDNAEEFVNFITENKNAESKVYCKLNADITADFKHRDFPAGISAKNLVIDGQGYSVKGFKLSGAMFESLADSSIRNIKFEDITVTTADKGAVIALETNKQTNITNCTFSLCTLDFSTSTKAEAGFAVVLNKGVIKSVTVEDTCRILLNEKLSDYSKIGGIAAENSYYIIGSVSKLKASEIENAQKVSAYVDLGLIVGENTNSSGVSQCIAVVDSTPAFGDNITFNPLCGYGNPGESCYYLQNSQVFTFDGEAFTKTFAELAVELNSKLMERNSIHTGDKEDYALLFKLNSSNEPAISIDGKEAWIKVLIDDNFYSTKETGKEIESVTFTCSDPNALSLKNDKNQVKEILTRVGYFDENGSYIRNTVTVEATCKRNFYSLKSVINQLSYGYMSGLQDVFADEGTNYAVKTFFTTVNTSTHSSKAEVAFSPCNSKITISSVSVNDQVDRYHFLGSGTEESPFEITGEDDLDVLRHYIEQSITYTDSQKKEHKYSTAHYILKNDITLSHGDFAPIGNYNSTYNLGFEGVFDGNFKSIYNYKYSDSTSYIGFFGLVKGTKENPAIIKNLNIINAEVLMEDGKGSQRGILAGTAINTVISGCTVSGTLEGTTQIGGLAGYISDSTVANCAVDVKLTSNYVHAWVGGIAGFAQRSEFINSYCLSEITAYSVVKPEYLSVGAIAGYAEDSKYMDCYHDSSAKNGETSDAFKPSWGSGTQQKPRSTVKSDSDFLATLKKNADKYSFDSQWHKTAFFDSCPTPCTRQGLEYFVLPLSSNAGEITTDTKLQKAGSLITVNLSEGVKNISVTDLGANELDIEISLSADGTSATFTMPDRSIRIVPVGDKSAFAGSGTDQDPFVINNIDQLKAMAEAINSREKYNYYYISGDSVVKSEGFFYAAHFALGNDIEGSNALVDSIKEFNGDLDGHGHSISGITVNGSALFEFISNSTLKNIIIENVEINAGSSQYASVIATELGGYTTIMNATFRNISVNGGTYMGCVSGKYSREASSSRVENCYFESIYSNAGRQGFIFGVAEAEIISSPLNVTSCIFADCSTEDNIGKRPPFSPDPFYVTISFTESFRDSEDVTDEILADYSKRAEQNNDYALWGRDEQGRAFVAGGDNREVSYINLGVDAQDKAVFTDSHQIKLLDTSRLPEYAAEGDKVTLYYYTHTSLVDFRILHNNMEIPYTTGEEADSEGYGEIVFTMPEGQVTLSNHYADTVLIIPGYGTEESPYLISSPEELKFIEKVNKDQVLQYRWYDESYVPYLSAYFKLENDIDMSGVPFGGLNSKEKAFEGTLDGAFYTIRNLHQNIGSINSDTYGLTLALGENGVIKNLYLDNAYTALHNYEGSVGVVAGVNRGIISKCMVKNSQLEIVNSGTSAYNYGAFITGYNTEGAVVNNCAVVNCYLKDYAANNFVNSIRSTVANRNEGIIVNTFAFNNEITDENGVAYGFVFENGGTVQNCYYYSEGNLSDSSGAKSVTKAQFKSGEVAFALNGNVTEEGVDWYQNIDNGKTPEDYPDFICNNDNYVYDVNLPSKPCSNYPLQEQLDKDFEGRFLIGCYEDLCVMSEGVNRGIPELAQGDYLVINSFDVAGKPLDPIGYKQTDPFKGTLDGQGYTISNVTVYGSYGYGIGLFGYSSGKIENLNLDGEFKVESRDERVLHNIDIGVLVGKALKQCEVNNVQVRVNLDLTEASFVYALGGVVGGVNSYYDSVKITKASSSNTYTFNDNLIVYYFGGILGNPHGAVNIDSCYVDLKDNPLNISISAGGIVGDGGLSDDDIISNSHVYGKFTNTQGSFGPVVGRIINDFSFTDNVYYLDTLKTGDNNHDKMGTPCTEAQFASGKVARLLNKEVEDGTQVWYQNLDNGKPVDIYPVFEGGTVYKNTKCSGELTGYSNTKIVDEHSFNNYNVCMKCIGLKEGKLSGIHSFRVGLGGRINVTYYMVLDEQVLNDPEAKLVFTVPQSGSTYTEEFLVSEAETQGKFYIFTCGVAAKEMTSEIKCQIVTSKDLEGENDVFTYSVKQYADYILDNADTYPDAVEVVKAMLNYGAYCQLHFDYRTDDLANASEHISEEEKVLKDCDLSQYQYTYSGYQEGVEYYGSSLVFKTGTDIKHYFYFNNPKDVETLNVTVKGEKVTPLPNGSYHYVRVEDIPVHNLHKPYEVCVGDLTLNYSALSYGYVILQTSDSETMKNVVKALYAYYTEAMAFRAKQ